MTTYLGNYGYVPNFWEQNKGLLLGATGILIILALIIYLSSRINKATTQNKQLEQQLSDTDDKIQGIQQQNQDIQTWINNINQTQRFL